MQFSDDDFPELYGDDLGLDWDGMSDDDLQRRADMFGKCIPGEYMLFRWPFVGLA